jgi:mRNA interferase RelE/StbE
MANPFRVELTATALRQLEKLAPALQHRLTTAMSRLGVDPLPSGAKRLRGSDGLLRIRVGNYRILYRVIDDRLVVLVIRVGHRREVYRGMARRLLGR